MDGDLAVRFVLSGAGDAGRWKRGDASHDDDNNHVNAEHNDKGAGGDDRAVDQVQNVDCHGTFDHDHQRAC